jgi:hypothetical protein
MKIEISKTKVDECREKEVRKEAKSKRRKGRKNYSE